MNATLKLNGPQNIWCGYLPARYARQALTPVAVGTFSSWLSIVASVILYCLLSRISFNWPSELPCVKLVNPSVYFAAEPGSTLRQ